mmetsp:Transcript_78588/g.197473  ORF Transcript_78588/g.197473 Transcript_78588/m.197473 type:complete len:98 (-) Transcript_78588:691-984(-)
MYVTISNWCAITRVPYNEHPQLHASVFSSMAECQDWSMQNMAAQFLLGAIVVVRAIQKDTDIPMNSRSAAQTRADILPRHLLFDAASARAHVAGTTV